MKIISGGKKDYYDYLAGIYGIDNDIVYDRRDSTVFKAYGPKDTLFIKEVLYGDFQRKMKNTYRFDGKKWKFGPKLEGYIQYILIEIGYVQYFFLLNVIWMMIKKLLLSLH